MSNVLFVVVLTMPSRYDVAVILGNPENVRKTSNSRPSYPPFLNPLVAFEVHLDHTGAECGVLVAQPAEWVNNTTSPVGRYDPWADRRLFLKFSKLDYDDGPALAKFASRNGMLFLQHPKSILQLDPCYEDRHVESVDEWRWHILQVRYLLEVRDILLQPRSENRAKLFRELDERYDGVATPTEVTGSSGRRITVGTEWKQFWIRPAVTFGRAANPGAYETIWHDNALNDIVSQVLYENSRFIWRRQSKTVTFHPINTLGAIYITLVDELGNEGTPLRQCEGCGIRFRSRRLNHTSCSERCRKILSYRNKKKKDAEAS